MWTLTAASGLAVRACLAVSVSLGPSGMFLRLASRVTLAIRAGARDEMKGPHLYDGISQYCRGSSSYSGITNCITFKFISEVGDHGLPWPALPAAFRPRLEDFPEASTLCIQVDCMAVVLLLQELEQLCQASFLHV